MPGAAGPPEGPRLHPDSFRAWQHLASDGLRALLSLWLAEPSHLYSLRPPTGFSPDLTRRIAVLRFSASGPPRPTKGRFVPRHKPSLRHPLARESIVNLVIRQKQDHLSFTQCIHIDYLSELGARPLSKTALFRRADHGPTDKLTSEQYCLSSRLSASDRSCRVGPFEVTPLRHARSGWLF